MFSELAALIAAKKSPYIQAKEDALKRHTKQAACKIVINRWQVLMRKPPKGC